MKKKVAIITLIITIIIFLVGMIMIFKSTSSGRWAGHNEIQKNGGSMDTQQYLMIIEATTENYRASGMILSLLGGAGILMSGLGIYKEIENTND